MGVIDLLPQMYSWSPLRETHRRQAWVALKNDPDRRKTIRRALGGAAR